MKTNLVAWLLILSSLLTTQLLAQSDPIQLKGKVLSAKDDTPLPYAYVQIQGLAVGTVTDNNGVYSLQIPQQYSNKKLDFFYLGYQKQSFVISAITDKSNFVVKLAESSTMLSEVTIEPRKQISAKKLWKSVLSNLNKNYGKEAANAVGYYRETIQENDAYIKYADAACSFHLAPMPGKNVDKTIRKNFRKNRGVLVGRALGNYWGDRLHRGHFNGYTLPEDQLQIIQARASEDFTKKRMHANIEGGPIGLLGKDRLKYLRYFSDVKNWKKYQFDVKEYQNEAGEWEYVLNFSPITTPQTLKQLRDSIKNPFKRLKAVRKIYNQPIAGKIYIDQQNFAVSKISFSVPKNYKELICNFKVMAIKHFDYKVDIRYEQVGEYWQLKHIRQEDEFIFIDTTGVENVTTPYRAVSELFMEDYTRTNVAEISLAERFANADQNALYEYPLDYDSAFWESYVKQYPIAQIPDEVRAGMEAKKNLETQFRDRFIRDDDMPPPIARKEASVISLHGKKLVDEYAWMKDTKAPKQNDSVMNYLEAENAYFDNYVIPAKKAQRKIFNELVWRIRKASASEPVLDNGYWYTTRYKLHDEYPTYYRRKDEKGSKWETLLDVGKMAEGQAYYSISGITISPDNRILLYAENTDGTDNSIVYAKDLETGTLLKDSLEKVISLAWVADSKSFYYTRQEDKTNRSNKVYKHLMGTSQQKDKLIYEEKDLTFEVSVSNTKHYDYIFMGMGSRNSTEVHFKKGDDSGDFQCIAPRQPKTVYSVNYLASDSMFYIMTDWKAPNMRLMKTTPAQYAQEHWEEIAPENPDALLTGYKKFKNYLTLQERGNATSRVKVIDLNTNESHYIKIKDEMAMVGIGFNPKSDSDSLRISYSSLTSESKLYNYHMGTREQRLVRKDTVRFMRTRSLKSKRIWATAADGTQIPITLVYNKYRVRSGSKYLWLTSYGAYGAGQRLSLPKQATPLLDRGFVYAIAHVRGGDDMGRKWYEQGKMFHKKNTFTDFIACAEALIDKGYTEKGKIVAQGGSAGGLLMGAIANMRPDLFHTIILDVPFVDVINTMLDDQLPLTTGEYKEWGNPNVKKEFEYMYSYSPYDNVKKQAYPNLFFFTGVNDQRVKYWEPAKMVAKLRQHNTSDNVILLHTNMSAGHGGNSGRYAGYSELAFKYAVLFDIINREGAEKKLAE